MELSQEQLHWNPLLPVTGIIHDEGRGEGVCTAYYCVELKWSGKYSRKVVFTFENLMVSEAGGDCVLCSVGGCGVGSGKTASVNMAKSMMTRRKKDKPDDDAFFGF